MDHITPDTVTSDLGALTVVVGDEEVTAEECQHLLHDRVSQYVQQNPRSTNTKLFSILALLNAYVPESYLLMPECQRILGPPDLIHGGPPFEERMEPFTDFISTSHPDPGQIALTHQVVAQHAVRLLAESQIPRSETVWDMMSSLCGTEVKAYAAKFIQDLLTRREMRGEKKTNFSLLVEDILEHESFYKALNCLRTASYKFRQSAGFPQVVSRLNYIAKRNPDYLNAEKWANRAIRIAPNNSYFADTLGQVYKNRLLKTSGDPGKIISRAHTALMAFKEAATIAEAEVAPGTEAAGSVNTSSSFNNRGRFGFIQVAKITCDKLRRSPQQRTQFIQENKMEVEAQFEFFEWYLTFSTLDRKSLEPSYFWKDIALCYEIFTSNTAAESTSFPGLLDCLNHGLFKSRGKRARFQEAEKTVSDLEAIREALKTNYEQNADDVDAAKRYILSNIILSNREPGSPQLTPVEELQTVIQTLMGREERPRSPEFYLLALLLFWPEPQLSVVHADEREETQGDLAPGPRDHGDAVGGLQQYITFMEEAFEETMYDKYLRGRYLLPLFFLGKSSGLSKWIHKSKLDAIVERKVDAELGPVQPSEKAGRIDDIWISGEVWQVPEIQDILLPVRGEPGGTSMVSWEQEEQEVFVVAGGNRMKVSVEDGPDASMLSTKLFYLGFNIKGPVLISGDPPVRGHQNANTGFHQAE